MKSSNERCGTCACWLPNNVKVPDAPGWSCLRFPPQVYGRPDGGAAAAWPITGANDWCFEWKPVLQS